MNKLVKYVRYACLALVALLTACIRDGLEECPPESEYYSYIRFVYDYNMSFEDLFHRQVGRVNLYLFDEAGAYMGALTDQAPTNNTFGKGYIMGLPELYKDATQFVAFAGRYDNLANTTNMLPGTSTINDLCTALHDRLNKTIDIAVEPLWHGNIAGPGTRVNRNDTTLISLTKNTNSIRVVLQSLVDDAEVNVTDFSFCLQAANADYDAYNRTADPTVWHYHPFHAFNDPQTGAVAELHTMRLLAEKENRFTVTQLSTGTALLDINLNKYINALKLEKYDTMSLQEYMDREDEFSIIIFLTKANDPERPNDENWVATQISINSWVSRDQGGIID